VIIVAIALGIPHGGWCPKGRKAEDDTIPAVYQLQVFPKTYYKQCTEWNVRGYDDTLILTRRDLRIESGTGVTPGY
jgi:Circularly permutated YpsA SLOG family